MPRKTLDEVANAIGALDAAVEAVVAPVAEALGLAPEPKKPPSKSARKKARKAAVARRTPKKRAVRLLAEVKPARERV